MTLTNPCCKNCTFARPIGNDVAVACHRYPPKITKVEEIRITSHFPLLGNEEWCGEWKRAKGNNQIVNLMGQ